MDRADPFHPASIGSINHFRAKDPVVVKDSMAYVTLRRGTDRWWAATDELMVVNIASIVSPKLIKEIALSTPYGLAARDTLLYVAQGHGGWTLFSLSNPMSPAILTQWSNPNVKDFIWIKDRLYLMCFDRIRIYSVANPLDPVFITEVK